MPGRRWTFGDRGGAAARGARSGLARPRPVGRRRRRGDDRGNAGQSDRRLARASAAREPAANAQRRPCRRSTSPAPAGSRAAERRSTSTVNAGTAPIPARNRLRAALERRRAGSASSTARSTPASPIPCFPSSGRRMTGALTLALQLARNHREAAGARIGAAERRRIPGRPDGLQAHRNHRDTRRQRRHDPHRSSRGSTPNGGSICGDRRSAARPGRRLSRLHSRDRPACPDRRQRHCVRDRRHGAQRLGPARPEAGCRRTHHDRFDGHLCARSLQQRLRSHSRHEACQSDARQRGPPRADRQGQSGSRPRRPCSMRRSTSRFPRPTAFSSAVAASMPKSAAICMSPARRAIRR